MDYPLFESRVMEVLFKTGQKLTPQLAAFKIGCGVEAARRHLEQMAVDDILVMEVDPNGVIQYDVPSRPPPTNEPLSWTAGGGVAQAGMGLGSGPGAPVHQHGVAPVSIQIHNALPPHVVVLGREKNVTVAALAGLFFGPLGMLYSTGLGALVMFLVGLMLIPLTAGTGLLLTAPACAIWAAHAASEHNQRLRASAQPLLAPASVVVHHPPGSSQRSLPG